ncbi:MAG: cation:dicarboxylate symporter family transporter, partial [Pseudothermotoga sp.]
MRFNLRSLTTQVVIAIILGILFGQFFPKYATELKVLADIFIKLIKMVIPPIIFLTVVHGIASMGDMKKLGRVGGKALLYFEIVTTFALAIGIFVANFIKPGEGVNATAAKASAVAQYTKQAAESSHGVMGFIQSIIPDNFIGALTKGELLPVLFVAVMFGLALASMGERSKPVLHLFERITEAIFKMVDMT